MAVIALLDRRRGDARCGDVALDGNVVAVENPRAVARDDDPVALLQIGDLLREWRQRQRVGTEIGLAVAIADDERRAEPRADQQVGMVAECDGEREGAAQFGEHRLHRFFWRLPRLDPLGDQMRDDLGIGIALETTTARGQRLA